MQPNNGKAQTISGQMYCDGFAFQVLNKVGKNAKFSIQANKIQQKRRLEVGHYMKIKH